MNATPKPRFHSWIFSLAEDENTTDSCKTKQKDLESKPWIQVHLLRRPLFLGFLNYPDKVGQETAPSAMQSAIEQQLPLDLRSHEHH